MSRARVLPEPAVGQRWALMDRRYDGYRYFTVTEVTDTQVLATSNTPRGRTRMRRDRFGRGGDWTFCGHDGPGILPPFTAAASVSAGCLNCPPKPTTLTLTEVLDPGYGYTTVYRDGEVVQRFLTTRKRVGLIEYWARQTPGDWRIRIQRMLSEQLYQRQDSGWVLVAIGMGIA